MTKRQSPKTYDVMTADEQLQWITDYSEWKTNGLPRIKELADDLSAPWKPDDYKTMQRGLLLLESWQCAKTFVEDCYKYCDYNGRAYLVPTYIEKVEEALTALLPITETDGERYVKVGRSMPLRRRGRPTKEEIAARERGETQEDKPEDSAYTRTLNLAAEVLGLKAIVTNEAPREKNNAELAIERQKREAEYKRQNPGLFDNIEQAGGGSGSASGTVSSGLPAGNSNDGNDEANATPTVAGGAPASPTVSSGLPAGSSAGSDAAPNNAAPNTVSSGLPAGNSAPVNVPTVLMADVYAGRIERDRLALNQLAWMCSPSLRERIEMVRDLRAQAGQASERGKVLAEVGRKKESEVYNQQAHDTTAAVQDIYNAIDEELSILHRRLQLDEPFREKFIKKHSTPTVTLNIEQVLYITRPYYEKMKSAALDLRVKSIIEQEDPAYAAKMRAQAKVDAEVHDILRYLKRKDKDASDTRLATARKRFKRLEKLLGAEKAAVYRPFLIYIEDENKKFNEAKAAKKASKQETKKAIKKATKKVQGDKVQGTKKVQSDKVQGTKGATAGDTVFGGLPAESKKSNRKTKETKNTKKG